MRRVMNKRRSRRAQTQFLGFKNWRLQRWSWRTRFKFASAVLTAVAALATAVYWADRADIPARAMDAARATAADLSVLAGFSVREVYVDGRKESTRKLLLKALRVKIGDPILFFEADTARDRLRRIPWIESVRVERRLPDTIKVFLKEREPIAIWQRNKRFVLIDKEGTVIGPDELERFRHLKIVVGPDAPKHAPALLAMLNKEPELMDRVTHATWVSGRRWNVRIENAIDVRLPADNPEEAWRKLTKMEKEFGLLNRDITVVDMRVPGRMTVRMNRKPSRPVRSGGRT
jgi:cell division protein FtsQ